MGILAPFHQGYLVPLARFLEPLPGPGPAHKDPFPCITINITALIIKVAPSAPHPACFMYFLISFINPHHTPMLQKTTLRHSEGD